MEKQPLYEGKAKRIYSTDVADELLVYYKDDATAFNGLKKGTIDSKGVLNNKITTFFFDLLGKKWHSSPLYQKSKRTGAAC
jgi:phosphoribosylaminoimidazole-succinocarboxamide synthase